jgi:hypothetical protein
MEIKKTFLGLLTYDFFGKPETKIVKINVCKSASTGPVNMIAGRNTDTYFYEHWSKGDLHYKQISETEFNKMINDFIEQQKTQTF